MNDEDYYSLLEGINGSDEGHIISKEEDQLRNWKRIEHGNVIGWEDVDEIWCTSCGSAADPKYHNHITIEDYKLMEIVAYCPHCEDHHEFEPELEEWDEKRV
tara:strand:- start:124 stop:429 length:306 start_codon:yes stop_codon:yes gene_type:complete